MAEAYGLTDPGPLLDAVMARQQDNPADALARTRSPVAAVAAYARASVAWQREQMAWLREHQAAFSSALGSAAVSRPQRRQSPNSRCLARGTRARQKCPLCDRRPQ